MKYKNSYKYIIKKVTLPAKLDDSYVKNRTKFQSGRNSYTIEYG